MYTYTYAYTFAYTYTYMYTCAFIDIHRYSNTVTCLHIHILYSGDSSAGHRTGGSCYDEGRDRWGKYHQYLPIVAI